MDKLENLYKCIQYKDASIYIKHESGTLNYVIDFFPQNGLYFSQIFNINQIREQLSDSIIYLLDFGYKFKFEPDVWNRSYFYAMTVIGPEKLAQKYVLADPMLIDYPKNFKNEYLDLLIGMLAVTRKEHEQLELIRIDK